MNAATAASPASNQEAKPSLKKQDSDTSGPDLFSGDMLVTCGQGARIGLFAASRIAGFALPTLVGAAAIRYGVAAVFGD
jgi:hypothetical protein